MPFTFSHPAAVLPFLNRSKATGWKPALVFGSISPDLWFGVPVLSERWVSHGRFGLLIDPPLAFALSWIFCRWLSPRLSRLPGLGSAAPRAPFHPGFALLGAFLGTLTHMLWDQFTHTGSRIQDSPIFMEPVPLIHGIEVPLGQTIWFANSIAGALVLFGWLAWKIHHREHGWREVFSRSWLSIAGALVAPFLLVLLFLKFDSLSGPGGMRRLLQLSAWVRLAMLASVLASLAAALWSTRSPRPTETEG
jgi:hypothetical protein